MSSGERLKTYLYRIYVCIELDYVVLYPVVDYDYLIKEYEFELKGLNVNTFKVRK